MRWEWTPQTEPAHAGQLEFSEMSSSVSLGAPAAAANTRASTLGANRNKCKQQAELKRRKQRELKSVPYFTKARWRDVPKATHRWQLVLSILRSAESVRYFYLRFSCPRGHSYWGQSFTMQRGFLSGCQWSWIQWIQDVYELDKMCAAAVLWK